MSSCDVGWGIAFVSVERNQGNGGSATKSRFRVMFDLIYPSLRHANLISNFSLRKANAFEISNKFLEVHAPQIISNLLACQVVSSFSLLVK